jgi:hypothetical protein
MNRGNKVRRISNNCEVAVAYFGYLRISPSIKRVPKIPDQLILRSGSETSAPEYEWGLCHYYNLLERL